MVVIPFKDCSTFNIVGATGCGKTYFLYLFIKNLKHMFDNMPTKILFCYNIYQPLYDSIKKVSDNVEFHLGLPTEDTIQKFANDTHRMIIMDDLMDVLTKSPEVERLFFVGSHHLHLSVITLTQNLYHQGSKSRTISLNTQYIVLFRNYRDSNQIALLARQFAPGKHVAFMEAYNDATLKPYGYLVVDFTPTGKEEYRIRSKIMPKEYPIIYQL